jgi:hypothetical protein
MKVKDYFQSSSNDTNIRDVINTTKSDEGTLKYELSNENKYVCLYCYYEKNDNYKENFIFFLENAILDNIDYYIIINGNCSLDIPQKTNIIVVYRENTYYDFGGWSYCINNHIKKKYDYYIFLNTSVRGPYLNDLNTNWLNEYLKLFNNDDVKLVGSSINMYSGSWLYNKLVKKFNHTGPFTHIQSMFFILNSEGYEYVKDYNFFNENYNNFNDVVAYKEIGLSQLILKNNWNINCILSKYRNHDYRILKTNINTTGDDPYYVGSYFGDTIDKYEVIFFKNNRW